MNYQLTKEWMIESILAKKQPQSVAVVLNKLIIIR